MKTTNRFVFLALALTCTLPEPALAQKKGADIVPGKRIGGVRIGYNTTTLAKLGKPATGDAAMQKEWMTWYSTPPRDQPNAVPAELDIYAVLSPDGDGKDKGIEEARVTSSVFKISNGISTGSSFTRIKRAYPHVKLIKTYSTKKSNGPIEIYDDVKRGIAFEIYRGRDGKAAAGQCSAIIAHRPGSTADDGYLSLSGYLEGLSDSAEGGASDR